MWSRSNLALKVLFTWVPGPTEHPCLTPNKQISQTSDDHTPSLSSLSGPWKLGTTHRARVTGYFSFDGLLQLSLKPSTLEQKFLQVSDFHVGELLKGPVKKLTDTGLFVSLSGNLDGVVWPSHYADIALKHPSKRFKVGGSVKCRVRAILQPLS